MKNRYFGRLALSIGTATALLAGCGSGSPWPIGAPGATPQIRAVAGRSGPSSYHVVYKFRGSRGTWPLAPLLDVNGTLYGTTSEGGAFHLGTVYSISPSGAQTVLHSFAGNPDGASPYAGLAFVGGSLYGTTYDGGAEGVGTVFSVSPSGSEKVLYSFTGGSDGGLPSAGLIDVNGTLYGTTAFGGDLSCTGAYPGCGTVYSITTSGSENVLHRFTDGSDGAFPDAELLNVGGTLYGTTAFGGDPHCESLYSSCGTVYRITTSGSEKTIYRFAGGSDGVMPVGGLIEVKGKLFGATRDGGGTGCGHPGCGVVYRVSTSGAEKVLHRFGSGSNSDGGDPEGDLVDVNGTLYGTTRFGGVTCSGGLCGPGTIYSVTTTGTEAVLYRFNSGTGRNPSAGLVEAGGVLYGTTNFGGRGCPRRELIGGCGTVFAFSP